jgi:hypothetical protein
MDAVEKQYLKTCVFGVYLVSLSSTIPLNSFHNRLDKRETDMIPSKI